MLGLVPLFSIWGDSFTLVPVPFTGIDAFDLPATLVLCFGFIAMGLGWLFNIMTRS